MLGSFAPMSSAGAYLFDVVRSPRGKARADGGLAPLKPQELVRQLCASLDTRLDDEACARAPKTAALMDTLPICRIPDKAPNVFFSILKAGSHIPPHTGVTNVRGVVHLPLIVPDGCEFRVGGETRAWVPGQAFAFDDTIEHEAWNRSEHDRAVLIIDVWNPHLSDHEREMVCRFYSAAGL